jgi:hypothetical protein
MLSLEELKKEYKKVVEPKRMELLQQGFIEAEKYKKVGDKVDVYYGDKLRSPNVKIVELPNSEHSYYITECYHYIFYIENFSCMRKRKNIR